LTPTARCSTFMRRRRDERRISATMRARYRPFGGGNSWKTPGCAAS
jgi:hypothetical protein